MSQLCQMICTGGQGTAEYETVVVSQSESLFSDSFGLVPCTGTLCNKHKLVLVYWCIVLNLDKFFWFGPLCPGY